MKITTSEGFKTLVTTKKKYFLAAIFLKYHNHFVSTDLYLTLFHRNITFLTRNESLPRPFPVELPPLSSALVWLPIPLMQPQ